MGRRRVEELPERYRAQAAAALEGARARGRKWRNVPCEEDGERFDSRLERAVWKALVARHGRRNVIRQVSLPVGKLRIRPDFLVIHERRDDGRFVGELVDAKGATAREWAAKANHLEDAHGLEVRVVRGAGEV